MTVSKQFRVYTDIVSTLWGLLALPPYLIVSQRYKHIQTCPEKQH